MAAVTLSGGYHHQWVKSFFRESVGGRSAAGGYYRDLSRRDPLSHSRRAGGCAHSINAAKMPRDGVRIHGERSALTGPGRQCVEFYWVGPSDQWPRTPDGKLTM